MRKIVSTILSLCFVSFVFAQNDTIAKINTAQKFEARSNDHFMFQIGYIGWAGKPDSIKTKGFSHSLNLYVMLDFPFKTNPHWSVALGPGIATDNIYFDKTYVGISDLTSTLHFTNLADTVHFKKYKLATAYLEAPVELRYRFNPNDDKRSVKIALGAKIGTLLNAHLKETQLQTKSNTLLNDYIQKESSKRFFNKNRLSVMARIGYGHYSLFASYSVTPLFKEGLGPSVRPVSIGLTISGL